MERAGPRHRALAQSERREPEELRAGELAGREEATGLEEGEAMLLAAAAEEGAIEVAGDTRRVLARGVARRVGREKAEPVARQRVARRGATEPQRRRRPGREILVDERQIEEPFAGIVDDVEREGGERPHHAPEEALRAIAEREPGLARPRRRLRPARRVLGEALQQ